MARLAVLVALSVLVAPAAAAPHRIMVSIPPQKFLAERIAGELAEVRVFLEPGQVPETWEPRPSTLARLAGTDLYLAIGVPFEASLLKRIRAQFPAVRVMDCCAGLAATGVPVTPGSADPHIWTSPAVFLAYAQRVRDTLSALDAGNGEVFAANFRRLDAELKALGRDIEGVLATRRIDEFIIDHGALGYLAAEYGLVQVALEQGGREMGTRTLAGVLDLARSRDIRTVFSQRQHRSAAAQVLAREIGGTLVELDLYDPDYPAGMRHLAGELAAALR